MRVKKSLLKFISQDIDRKRRLQSARREGADFLALSPSEQVTALFVISHDSDSDVAVAAYETLAGADEAFILSALGKKLHNFVLRELFLHFRDSAPLLSAIIRNSGIDNRLAYTIAREGSAETLNAFIEHPAIIGRFPSIVEGIKNNPLASEEQRQYAEEAAGTKSDEAPAREEEEEPPSEEDEAAEVISSGDDFDSDRFNIYQAICNMTAGEKIKLAHTGDRSVRNLLIKDKNRVVALSVLKNPKLTEQEVTMVASSTNTSEELLRDITKSREWMKSYNIKTAIVLNPRTPLGASLKLIDYLRERDLKQLAKNKGVPGVLKAAADRKLMLKNRH